jgi:cellulose biosynthesis protein BcsQ
MKLRSTYAQTEHLQYRLRAAGALLGVTDNTLRGYADNAGIPVKRACDITPGAPAIRVFEPNTLFMLAQWRRQQGYIKAPSSGPIVITVDVIKGGTGKTTTSVETAIHLQLLGLKVLLIDLDIQANATQLMGYEPDLTLEEAASYGLDNEAIVTDTFASLILPFLEAKNRGASRVNTSNVNTGIKKPFGNAGPHLIPADTFLGDVESALANSKGQRELYIKQFIAAAAEGKVRSLDASSYDVIIFDCPPSVSFTSTAALAAADFVIAPIRLDAFSVKGLTKLMSEINALDEAYKVRPELIILPTHYAPQFARIGRMQAQLTHYRDLLAPNVISATEEFPKSLDNYLPLTLQKPTSTGAKEYKLFAEHLHTKILAKATEKNSNKS